MTAGSNDALKRDVQEVFGVTMSDEQVEAAKGRLPTMLANARLLGDWAGRLGEIGPAQVLDVIETPTAKPR